MKFCINTDDENYGPPRYYTRILERWGWRDDGNDDVVLNISSIHNKGIRIGKKCTVYIEGDEFLTEGSHKELYERTDLLYISDKSYIKLYPKGTKAILAGVDIDAHYPRDIEKEWDYIFIGRCNDSPVYSYRKGILDKLLESKFKVLVTECDLDKYCDISCSGKIILNILPKNGDNYCVNMRVFEGMAMGVLMNDHNKLLDYHGFIKNVHYLPLDRFGEKFKQKELNKIHEAGRNFVIDNYSYQNALKIISRDVEKFIKTRCTK